MIIIVFWNVIRQTMQERERVAVSLVVQLLFGELFSTTLYLQRDEFCFHVGLCIIISVYYHHPSSSFLFCSFL